MKEIKKDFDFFAELKRLNLTIKDFCEIAQITPQAVSKWRTNTTPPPKWLEPFLKFYESHIILENLKKGGFYVEKESAPNIRERKLNARDLERLKRNEAKREQRRAQKENAAKESESENEKESTESES